MQRKNSCTGSATIAFLLATFLLIFTLTTLYVARIRAGDSRPVFA